MDVSGVNVFFKKILLQTMQKGHPSLGYMSSIFLSSRPASMYVSSVVGLSPVIPMHNKVGVALYSPASDTGQKPVKSCLLAVLLSHP